MATRAKAATAASALREQLEATKNATWKTTNEESQAVPQWGN